MKKRMGEILTVTQEQNKQIDKISKSRDSIRHEIKAFERLFSELRASTVASQNIVSEKVSLSLCEMNAALDEAKQQTTQVKAMVRNQTHHFTGLSSKIGQYEAAIDRLDKVVEPLPGLIDQVTATDLYLHKYQPM
jgi:methyl-accepting chemotaxis protein